MLTTTNNNESNNYSMLSSMSKDLMKKGDIKQRCTAACFGLVPISQDCYFCPKCDPGHKVHLCESCFDDCHFECTCEIDSFDKNNFKESLPVEFSCECFSVLKHKVNHLQKKEAIKCNLKILDKFLVTNKYFYCNDEKLLLCSFCYFCCHNQCNSKKVIQGKEVNDIYNLNSNISNFSICQCQLLPPPNCQHSILL